MNLLNKLLTDRAHFIWLIMRNAHFLPLKNLKYSNCCHVRNSSDTEAHFFDLDLPITNGIVSSTIYDKWDDFNFEIVNHPFLDCNVPHSPSYGVYNSQLIRFARVCFSFDDFNNRNKFVTSYY